MILFPTDFEKYQHELGSKTKNLKLLQDLRLEVPKFIAIPASEISRLYDKKKFQSENTAKLAKEIIDRFPLKQYAIRSSALIEDGSRNSFAGQFQTKLAQKPEQVETAIISVLTQAFEYLKGHIQNFSLIVQEYIEADFAGIAFTRNPLGGREMVIEYHPGRGEEIVSGKVKPEKISCYWTESAIDKHLPFLQKNIESLKTIESSLKFPQDIEWCIQDDRWYFLQTRPITTLNKKQYAEALYLDKTLATRKYLLLEKTEITEIAPRPTPFTFSLLQKIYAPKGPIDQVYKKYGVHYQSHDFLEIIGNEIYVNREEELKTILPAYSYKKKDLQPHLSSLSGFITTYKNIFNLNKISLENYTEILKKISAKISEKSQKEETFEQKIETFMSDYEIIFEANLLAEKALKKLEFALKSEKISPATALSLETETSKMTDQKENRLRPNLEIKPGYWTGNSLEIADESPFFRSLEPIQKNPSLENWFANLPKIKRPYLEKIIIEAKNFSKLREYGRWLTVKNIHDLRSNLHILAKKLKFTDTHLFYFFTITEIIEKEGLIEEKAANREKKYQKFNSYQLPSRLTTTFQKTSFHKPIGISPGKARGKLVDLENLDKKVKNNILYTKMLTPDLTEHFDKVKGIVSEQGGLLSHLAIIAREKGLPVVVNFDKANSGLNWNDEIEIDGGSGEIKKISGN